MSHGAGLALQPINLSPNGSGMRMRECFLDRVYSPSPTRPIAIPVPNPPLINHSLLFFLFSLFFLVILLCFWVPEYSAC